MPDDPKVDPATQAVAAVDAQAANKDAAASGEAQAAEPISLEKAKELRAENKSLRDRMKALEDEQKKRDDDAKRAADTKAKEEGRLADVLKERDEELATLKPRVDFATKLEGLFTTQFETESKDWPDEVRALIPEGLEARVDQWPKLRAAAAKFATATPAPGSRRGPPAAGGADPARAREAAKAFVRSLVP